MSYLKVPIGYDDLKRMLRAGLDVYDSYSNKNTNSSNSNNARTYWWPLLVTLEKGKSIDSYPDINNIAKRLMDMTDVTSTSIITLTSKETLRSSILTQCKIQSAINGTIGNEITDKDNVISRCSELNKLLSVHKGVEEPLLLQGILTIISSILQSLEISHLIICDILSNTNKYIAINHNHHKRLLYVFKILLSSYLPQTYIALDNMKALDDHYLNLMFVDFFVTLLPRKEVLRMFDAYLLEGYRILMRYSLALIMSYKKLIKSNAFETANDLWLTIQHNAKQEERSIIYPSCLNNNNKCCNDNIISNKIPIYKCSEIHINAYENERSVLGKAYRPMNISHQKLTEINSRYRDNKATVSLKCFGYDNNNNIVSINSTEESYSSLVIVSSNETKQLVNNSSILTLSTADRLIRLLPKTVTIDGLALVFTSKSDGWDISYLYNKLNGIKGPFVILLGTNTKANAIIGVFITAAISPPDNRTRGTGESFLFRLDDNDDKKYPWIGIQTTDGNNNSDNTSSSITTQFAILAKDYMSFGASDKHGTNGIYISSNLGTCSTGYSDTYYNPPLLSTSEVSSSSSSSLLSVDFDVKDIEVYSLQSNYTKALKLGLLQHRTSIISD